MPPSDPQARTKQIASVATAIAISITVYLMTRHRASRDSVPPPPVPELASGARPAEPDPGARPPASPHVRRMPDATARPARLAEIRKQAAQREAAAHAASGSAGPRPALPDGALGKDYIRASVKELTPLLVQCYEQALTRLPTLAGTITVDFTIEGEPGAGGVIGESSVIDDQSDLADPELRECIQETMYAIEIDPPAGGGVVHVHYPFKFASGDPAEASGSAGR